MPNRLAAASSPYLLQHRDNPVDWYEWGEAAFAAARAGDLPVLLSVGYSACHWCHVMAHESFEDPATAAYMNEHFINIKVDREERPDVDRIYMDALQAISGHGGWPMTVFLTPDAQPFFAGTYFPNEPRGQFPSFMQVMESVTTAWRGERSRLLEQSDRLTAAVRTGIPVASPPPVDAAVTAALQGLESQFDPEWGGFGTAPKFPQAPVLELLLRLHALRPETRPRLAPMLRRTLDAMRAGGIYDQIGGGFARYAVDGQWLIPHFEKMLYDNALLARIYLRAWQELDEPSYLTTAREILDYLMYEMRDPGGGFHSAEDADSEGAEGKYYLWSWREFTEVLGDRAPLLADLYGVTETGNFEGDNNLHLAAPIATIAGRHGMDPDAAAVAKKQGDAILRSVRATRVRPGRDDKIVTAWNGLALRAFAEAGAVLADPGYLDAARSVAEFILCNVVTEGRLARSWRDGRTSGTGFCDDYAAMAIGLFALFQATGEIRWYREAERISREMCDLFGADDGFYSPPRDATGLIARPKDFMDNPTPSANSLAAEALLILTAYTGEAAPAVRSVARGSGRLLQQYPTAVAHLLAVLATEAYGFREVAIVGAAAARAPLERVVWESFRPECVLAAAETGLATGIPLLEGRMTHNAATAYVCHDFVCDLPVSTTTALRGQLDARIT